MHDEDLFELLRRLRAADERRHRTDRGSAEELDALEETELLIDRIIGSDRHDVLVSRRTHTPLEG